MTSKRKKPNDNIGKKIKEALDGRTQRWLAVQVGMTDVDLSNRINGIHQFNQEQLDKINLVLDLNLEIVNAS